ncbi:ImmA/IrrE family metallo-endopeptidase [Klenkia terrae]|uniref:ImmA/IrrE family metallo-endopeptidase n=1 Tax=Klenkia terrae TaxID=1052259 RepID=UPI0036096F1B
MIDAHVDDLLRAADAYGRFPTPVNDIIEAAGLVEVPNHELDHAVLAQMPPEQRALVVQALPQLEGMLDRQARTLCVTDLVTNENRRRFVKLHEVVHGALPHQQALIYADNAETLSPSTRLMFEREANYGAAHLLFQRAAFAAEARSLSLSVASVQVLAARYGSSIHAAFRRYAETHDRAVLVLRLDLPKVRGTTDSSRTTMLPLVDEPVRCSKIPNAHEPVGFFLPPPGQRGCRGNSARRPERPTSESQRRNVQQLLFTLRPALDDARTPKNGPATTREPALLGLDRSPEAGRPHTSHRLGPVSWYGAE